jgi:hypothetical protein
MVRALINNGFFQEIPVLKRIFLLPYGVYQVQLALLALKEPEGRTEQRVLKVLPAQQVLRVPKGPLDQLGPMAKMGRMALVPIKSLSVLVSWELKRSG